MAIPHKRDLGLGKPLALKFAEQFLPDESGEVRQIFGRRGAYAMFNSLLRRSRTLDLRYDFETKAANTALREWCALNDITIKEDNGATCAPNRR